MFSKVRLSLKKFHVNLATLFKYSKSLALIFRLLLLISSLIAYAKKGAIIKNKAIIKHSMALSLTNIAKRIIANETT